MFRGARLDTVTNKVPSFRKNAGLIRQGVQSRGPGGFHGHPRPGSWFAFMAAGRVTQKIDWLAQAQNQNGRCAARCEMIFSAGWMRPAKYQAVTNRSKPVDANSSSELMKYSAKALGGAGCMTTQIPW